jgi:hypothetical protein
LINRIRARAVIAFASAAMSACLAVGEASASPARADTLRELYSTLNSCVRAPKQSGNSEITVAFRLKRDGSLIGSPWITYVNVQGDAAERKLFVGRVLASLSNCMPLSVTNELGSNIAGRAMVISILHRPVHAATSNGDMHRP